MTCHFAAIMASFSVEAIVRVYKDIWTTVVSEELPCQREDGNRPDPFAVFLCSFDVFKISHRKNFRSFNFCILRFCAKYVKFCTIRKFPAIRYLDTMSHYRFTSNIARGAREGGRGGVASVFEKRAWEQARRGRQGWGKGGRGRERVEGVEERWKGRERLDEVAYVSNVMRL